MVVVVEGHLVVAGTLPFGLGAGDICCLIARCRGLSSGIGSVGHCGPWWMVRCPCMQGGSWEFHAGIPRKGSNGLQIVLLNRVALSIMLCDMSLSVRPLLA
jgi:hypothetical protein